jgi:hypothetical protein
MLNLLRSIVNALGQRGAGVTSPPETSSSANSPTGTSHPELAFFKTLSGKLEIDLTAPTEQIGTLENVRATPEAAIRSLRLVAEVYNRDSQTFRSLTPEELQSVAFQGSEINLRSEADETVSHQAPNGKFFTVQDLLNAVEETERQTRDQSEWFDGVDVHHVYFEGIHDRGDGAWQIAWGS